MLPKILLLILYLITIKYSFCKSVRRKRDTETITESSNSSTFPAQTVTEWAYTKMNSSPDAINVRLHDMAAIHHSDHKTPELVSLKSNYTGLVEVLMPQMPGSLFLCFPDDASQYEQAYMFSHIACRQLGFMTFIDMNQKELSPSAHGVRYYGLRPGSYKCTGQEQNISYCNWEKVSIDTCQKLTEISCGDCQRTVRDFSGIVQTPGFPKAYLFDVTCEWEILTDLEHDILLKFHHSKGLFPETSNHCPLHKPYIEITYGISGRLNTRRLCSNDNFKNLTIPFREVKIKVFTGFYVQPQLQPHHKEKGIAISFEAILIDESNGWPWKMVFLTMFVLMFMTTTVICHYCQKYKLFEVRRARNPELPTVNVPDLEDLDRAYEFQRCIVQGKENEKLGLRLRSNGSGEKVSRVFFPNSPGTTFEIPKTCNQQTYQIETPKTIIPEIILEGSLKNGDSLDPISRVKANLLDRYSGSNNNSFNLSGRISASTPVFMPPGPTFEIYRSVTSENAIKKEEKPKKPPPPHETDL